MFDFLRRSQVRSPSVEVRHACEADGVPPETDFSSLRVVESRGTYAGRKVTHFSVFDPTRSAALGVDILAQRADRDPELDAYPGVVLRSGFIEPDGAIVLYRRPISLQVGVASEDAEPRRA